MLVFIGLLWSTTGSQVTHISWHWASPWKRHSRPYFPLCLTQDNIACDVDEVSGPDTHRRQDLSSINSIYFSYHKSFYFHLLYFYCLTRTFWKKTPNLYPLICTDSVLSSEYTSILYILGVCVFATLTAALFVHTAIPSTQGEAEAWKCFSFILSVCSWCFVHEFKRWFVSTVWTQKHK